MKIIINLILLSLYILLTSTSYLPKYFLVSAEITNVTLEETYPSKDIIIPEEYLRGQRFLSYFPKEYQAPVKRNSLVYDIKIEHIYRIMFMESRLGKYQESLVPNKNGTVDLGVMHLNSQYLDFFAKNFFEGNPEDFNVLNADHSIQVSIGYLFYLTKFVGSLEGAFISYNSGPGNYFNNTYPERSADYARVVLGMKPRGVFMDLSEINWN